VGVELEIKKGWGRVVIQIRHIYEILNVFKCSYQSMKTGLIIHTHCGSSFRLFADICKIQDSWDTNKYFLNISKVSFDNIFVFIFWRVL
jgi:hypothetical protein